MLSIFGVSIVLYFIKILSGSSKYRLDYKVFASVRNEIGAVNGYFQGHPDTGGGCKRQCE